MRTVLLSLVTALCALTSSVSAAPVPIKLAANVPTGSMWHNELKKLGALWKDLSGGEVTLTLYVGNVMGDEDDISKKLRIGQLQGAVLTSFSLRSIHSDAVALDLPLQLLNNTEYDAVAAKLSPTLDAKLAEKGFVSLGWTHVGWSHLFSTVARPTLTAARGSKLWSPQGVPEIQATWQAAGFKPVTLSALDIVPSLTTGMIDAVSSVPLIALGYRYHEKAKFMLDLPLWSQSAALVIDKKSWDQIPADLRAKLADSARLVLGRMTTQARAQAASALTQMKAQGLTPVTPTAPSEWTSAAETLTPTIRGKWLTVETFDAVKQAITDYRAGLR